MELADFVVIDDNWNVAMVANDADLDAADSRRQGVGPRKDVPDPDVGRMAATAFSWCA
jgi:hypothetical protein